MDALVKFLPLETRDLLLGQETSRQNKLALAASLRDRKGYFIEWAWQGEPMRSRLCFRFEPDGHLYTALSFEEDVSG